MLIRPYENSDFALLTALWNQWLDYDPITRARFLQLFLLDKNFQREGLLVAFHEELFAGFLQVITRKEAGDNVGYLTFFGVHPAKRRQGVASALLEAGMSYLREQGVEMLSCNGYAPYYMFPGVDERYTEANAFLLKQGFEVAGRPVAMGLNLEGVITPKAVREKELELDSERYTIRPFRIDDSLPLMKFTETHFPYWEDSIRDGLQHGNYDIILAIHDGEIVASAQWQNTLTDPPRGAAGRFGPFGVREDLRNKGVGAVVFYKMIEYVKERGHRYLWFGWAGGRNLSFYERAGCRITRQFTLYKRKL
ncbi:MAG: GNAT family N-acetyltransferase [Armatimonadetes bacterium]|nr:GNAT family N-acetyltransferase [Armatimonadota bacterium]